MRLGKRFKPILLASVWACFGSGVLWEVFERWVRVAGGLGEEHHPFQPWLIRVHAVAAYALLIGFGYLLPVHIQPGLRGKRRCRSGLALIGFFGVLTLSAFPVLYASDGPLREISESVHLYVGLLVPLALGSHLLLRRGKAAVSLASRQESETFALPTALQNSGSRKQETAMTDRPGAG